MKKILKVSLIIILVLVILASGGIMWHANSIISSMADVRIEKNSPLVKKYSEEIEKIQVESEDGLMLNAWQFGVANPKGIVIILHGMHGMDASSLLDYGKFFKDKGFSSICLDMRAHGQSQGEGLSFGYDEVKDVAALLDWIKDKEEYSNTPVIVYGLSMGGSTAIRTAAQREDVDMVISISAYEALESQITDYMRNMEIPDIITDTYSVFFNLVLRAKYKINPSKSSPIHDISQIKDIPILLVHGDMDDQTSVTHAYNLKDSSSENVELRIVEGSGHCIVDEILAEENQWFRDEIISFIEENLD